MDTGTFTVGGALLEGVQVTVLGMAIVFAVLIILMLVLMAFRAIFYKETPKEEAAPATPPVAPVAEPEEEEDEEELIAVLTAAAAACMNTSTYNLKIKSYRRIGNSSPAWNKAGLTDAVNHF